MMFLFVKSSIGMAAEIRKSIKNMYGLFVTHKLIEKGLEIEVKVYDGRNWLTDKISDSR